MDLNAMIIHEENIVKKRCDDLIQKSIEIHATDIQLIPQTDRYDVLIKSYGFFKPQGKLPLSLGERMVRYFKLLSSLDISEKRKPQSGSFQLMVDQKSISFRVSTLPTISLSESVVIRIQQTSHFLQLDQIIQNKTLYSQLQDLLHHLQGLFCVSGPTGSGKTTLLYAMTHYLSNELNRHIISLEDPVESELPHLLQIQVNEKSGITYGNGLKAILRHSPDVIMIGEIRDSDTARTAVQAALSGHFVLTTVHAKDLVGTLYRLKDFGFSWEELHQSIVGITYQKLEYGKGNQDTIQSNVELLSGQELERQFILSTTDNG